MRHRLLALLIFAAAIAVFFFLKASRPETPKVESRERSWRVAVMPAQPLAARPTLTLYGRIEAPDRLRVAAPVAGRVLEVQVRDGAKVAAGTPLLRMDPRDLEPRVAQARAELEREEVRARHDRESLEQERKLLSLAETKLARFDTLTTARLGAQSVADQAREDVARARLALNQREQAVAEHPARLVQARAKLDEALRDRDRATVAAPFDARVGKVEVAAGDQVQPGQTLLSLFASEALYLRAKLPAIHMAELRDAIARGEALRAEAQFGERRLALVLERIAGEADARGVDVLLRLENGDGVPLGAFMNAVLTRPAVEGVLSLPFSALHGGDRVYQVVDGRLKGLAVTRVGELREGGEPRLLVRVPALVEGAEVMITHLPNALDGLAVEVVRP